MPFTDAEALAERARNLGALNGMQLALVTLTPTVSPTQAQLDVYFWNTNGVAGLLTDPRKPWEIFPLSGGHRRPAGALDDMVRVTQLALGPANNALTLTIAPIGDYSTYTLTARAAVIDPVFGELAFKFRPGCFSTDCAPEWTPAPPPNRDPAIDYLAKDYDSFRHLLITAMQQRVPGWTPATEADLTEVLIDLLSAVGDELSDYQDRVMNEAYLAAARKRISLARHARLMDYYIYEGNQASTSIVLRVMPGTSQAMPPGVAVATASDVAAPHAIVFLSSFTDAVWVDDRVNDLGLYTWSDTRPALAAGDTAADVRMPDQATALAVRDLVRAGTLRWLVIQAHRSEATGVEAGADRTHRQLLRLLPGNANATEVQDPLTLDWMVRIRWDARDALTRDYCFTITRDDGVRVGDVCLFHGNVVPVVQGRPVVDTFRPPGTALGPGDREWLVTDPPSGRWGTLCVLPDDAALLYQNTEPRGETPTRSTLRLTITTGTGTATDWEEVSSFVHSGPGDHHFVVETDEAGRSLIRFGNGVGGLVLPEDAVVAAWYQQGAGIDGNLGADALTAFDGVAAPFVVQCWNPFDVVDGTAPEPVDEILRNVPEAYRARQLRAVTLDDYRRRAEELPGVQRAAARYQWTGSWRTVRLTIDPVGGTLGPDLVTQLQGWLEAVRLLGEDLEIRPPIAVPLRIDVVLCAAPDVWPQDLTIVLAQEFSSGYTSDGRQGFFHPDAWTFGQALYRSQIEGRLAQIPGVEHVVSISMGRWDAATPGTDDVVAVGPSEIVSVQNDPDAMELGSIEFDVEGGRQ